MNWPSTLPSITRRPLAPVFNVLRSRSSFSRGTEMVTETVSMSHPSTHNVYPTARPYEDITEWDPVRISPRRADNDATPETRTRVENAGHRATVVPPPISRRLRSIVQRKGSSSPLPYHGGPDNQVATEPADLLLSAGDRDMLRRGTPPVHHHGVIVRRVAMSVFEGCRKHT